METLNEEQGENLERIAFEKSDAFCYSCYCVVPPDDEGHCCCKKCGSDDLMRHLDGVGCEYGTEWVIESLVQENCSPIDEEEVFDDMMADYYGEIDICGMYKRSAVDVLKEIDPIAYDVAKSEYFSFLLGDGEVIEVGGNYFWAHEIEEKLL